MFGSGNNNLGFLGFGNANTSNTNTQQSPFGQVAGNNVSGFGTTSGSAFGSSSGTNQNANAAPKPAFGLGANTSGTLNASPFGSTGASTGAAPFLFGSNSNAAGQSGFGSAANTQNGASSGTTLGAFGGNSAMGFGAFGSAGASQLPFGAAQNGQSSTPFGAQSGQNGAQTGTQTGLGLFGAKPAAPAAGSSPFGQGFNASGANSATFGANSTSTTKPFGLGAPSQPASGSLFGAQNNAPAGQTNTTSQPSGGLFGSTSTNQTSAFGAPANASGTTSNAFGTPANVSGTTSNAFGTLANESGTTSNAFGTPANASGAPANASATPSTGFGFGNKEATHTSSTPFGAPTSTTSATTLSLFGGAKPAETKGSIFGGSSATSNTSSSFGAKPAEKTSDSVSSGAAATAKPDLFKLNATSSQTDTSKPTITSTQDKGESSTSGFSFAGLKSDDKKDEAPKTFSFGNKADAKKDEAPKTFSFGNKADEKKDEAPKVFSFGNKTEEKKDEAPKTFSFGLKSADTTSANTDKSAASTASTAPAPAFGFGAKAGDKKDDKVSLFSGAKTDDKAKAATGGFSFGPKPAETKGAEPAKPLGFSFGNTSTEKKDDKAPGLFGAKTDNKTDSKAPGLSFGSKPADTKTTESKSEKCEEQAKNLPNLKPTEVKPIAVSLDNKTMDDLVMKWSKQLSTTSSIFDTFTDKVKEWDVELAKSGDDISKLHNDTLEVDALHQRIDQQLLFVEGQQDELDKVLDNYELQAETLLNNIEASNVESALSPNGFSSTSSSDITDDLRVKAYNNAKLLDERLDSLGSNLETLVSEINSVSDVFNKSMLDSISGQNGGSDNSLEEIVKLLNLHLANLKYIENTKDVLEKKLAQAKGQKKLLRDF